jgi:hypothetical protein
MKTIDTDRLNILEFGMYLAKIWIGPYGNARHILVQNGIDAANAKTGLHVIAGPVQERTDRDVQQDIGFYIRASSPKLKDWWEEFSRVVNGT